MTPQYTVIGAGLVGVCCALHLQREGFTVRLVEKGEPGRGASFGNAGSFGTASCVPFSLPGILKKVPKMLLDSESPLKLRWSHVPRALPWFLAHYDMQFVAVGSGDRGYEEMLGGIAVSHPGRARRRQRKSGSRHGRLPRCCCSGSPPATRSGSPSPRPCSPGSR